MLVYFGYVLQKYELYICLDINFKDCTLVKSASTNAERALRPEFDRHR